MKKRALSLLLVFAMVFSLVVPAYADSSEPTAVSEEAESNETVIDEGIVPEIDESAAPEEETPSAAEEAPTVLTGAGVVNAEASNAVGSSESGSGDEGGEVITPEIGGDDDPINTFTVTLKANGGYFDGVPDSNEMVLSCTDEAWLSGDYGVQHSNAFMRFDGWYLDAEGASFAFKDDQYYVDADITLYAKWAECFGVTYVTEKPNTYLWDGSTQMTLYYPLGTPIESVPAVQESGLRFYGWNFEPDGSGDYIHTDFTSFTSDMTTVYAKFSEGPEGTYTIHFNGNGGVYYYSNDPDDYSASVAYVYYESEDGVWADYGFVNGQMGFDGWYYDADCTQLAYNRDEKIYPTDDITLYAKWVEGYGVTFVTEEPNTTLWDHTTQRTNYYPLGKPINSVPALINDSGREFIGWNLAADGSGDYINTNFSSNTAGVTTVYAQYSEPAESYTVTLNANGGYFEPGWYENTELTTRSDSVSFSADDGWWLYWNNYVPSTDAAKQYLAGWYYDEACTVLAIGRYNGMEIHADTTLYAKWGTYVTVTLDANGGYFYGDETQTVREQSFEEGELLGFRASYGAMHPDQATDPSVRFGGWFFDAACTQPIAADGSAYCPVDGVTLYANWVHFYKVTFDANGGYFFNDEQQLTYEQYTTPGDIMGSNYRVKPMKADLHEALAGWTDANGMDVDLDSYAPTGDVTLYAKWGEGWIVTFDANGGRVNGESEYRISVLKGDRIGTYYSAYSDDSDLSFAGWSLTQDFSSGTIPVESYIPTEDTTLYARYGHNYTYTYNANGGHFSWGGTTSTSGYCEFYQYTPLRDVYNDTPGMALSGWYADPECTQLVYGPNELFYPTSDMTLYAGWAEGWTVTFDAGDGYLFGDPDRTVYSMSVAKGTAIGGNWPSATSNDPDLQFQYWTLNGIEVNVHDYIPQGDVTFTPYYARSYKITLDANGGYFDNGEQTINGYVREGNSWWLGNVMYHADPHYAVEGWYYDADCTEFAAGYGEEFYPTGNVTLYAKWSEGYLVTFDANGGYFPDGNMTTRTVTVAMGNPIRHSYEVWNADEHLFFDYWALNADGTGRINGVYEYVPDGDVTLYAIFCKGSEITFNSNGGFFINVWTVGNGEYAQSFDSIRTWRFGEGIGFNGRILNPWNPDVTLGFSGWYYDESCTQLAVGPMDEFVPDGKLTLYAGWEPGHTITLYANGGYFAENQDQSDVFSFGLINGIPPFVEDQVYIPVNRDLQKIFDGWYTNPECSGESVDLYSFCPDSDMSFYAKWKDREPLHVGDNEISVKTNQSETYYFTPETDGTYVFEAQNMWNVDCTIRHNNDFLAGDYGFRVVCDLEAGETYRVEFNCWDYDQNFNMTIRASEVYTITLLANGGYFYGWSDRTEETVRVPVGEAIQFNGSVECPDDHMAFSGWTTDTGLEIGRYDVYNYVPSRDMTLTANYGEACLITLNANGGWFWGDPETTEITEKFLKGVPTGSGYMVNTDEDHLFNDKWSFTPECDETFYLWNYVPTEDVTLYAKLNPIYQVTFDANGGFFNGDEQCTTSIDRISEGGRVYFPGAQPQNSDQHLALEGWYLDAACTQPAVLDNGVPFSVESDVTLYAKWGAACLVTFDANGGHFDYNDDEGNPVTVVTGTYLVGKRVNFWENPVSDDAHTAFAEKWLDPDGNEVVLSGVDGFVPTGDITLKAVWDPAYLVTFDANGGIYNSNDKLQVKVRAGSIVEDTGLPFDSPYMEDGSAAFAGWSLDREGSEMVYSPLAIAPDRDMTVYAIWTEPCRVVFCEQDGTVLNTKIVRSGGYLQDATGEINMDDDQWYLDSACTIPVNLYTLKVEEDITLYRTQNIPSESQVTVHFDFDGGFWKNPWDETSQSEWDVSLTKGAFLGKGSSWALAEVKYLYKEGYSFAGYSTTKGGEANVDFYAPVFEDATYYAVWKPGVTVTLDANGRHYMPNEALAAVKWIVPVGESVSDNLPLIDAMNWDFRCAEKDSALIEGWYFDAACTQPLPDDYIAASDITLYAKWCDDTYYVEFVPNGAGRLYGMNGFYVIPGKPVMYSFIPGQYPYIVLDGYSLDREGTQRIDDVDNFVPTQKHTRIYMQWAEGYHVYLDPGSGYFGYYIDYRMIEVRKGEAMDYSQVPTGAYGRTIEGWYYDRELTRPVEDIEHFIPTDNITLYAKWSGEATPLKIVTQPKDVTCRIGETASFSVTATGEELSYQWYYMPPTESEFFKASNVTDTYSVVTAARHNGYKYYCVVTDANGNSVQTNIVSLTLNGELVIVTQPQDYTGTIGETASFTVAAEGDGLSYQWYYMPPTESEFFKASNKTDTYSVVIAARHDGYRYYCVVTDAYGNSKQSDTVCLTVSNTLQILTQPEDYVGPIGTVASFTVEAQGEGLSYKWYYQPTGDTKFYKSSASGATYTTAITAARNGYHYYCVVSDQYGNEIETVTVMLTAKSALKITQQPVDFVGQLGEQAVFTVVAEGEGLSYQWYYKPPTESKFFKGSSKTDTYTVTIAERHDGYEYYCIVTDEYGTSVQSETVVLTVNRTIRILTQPESYYGAVGEKAAFTVVAEGDGLKYQWFFKGPSDTRFYKATNTTDTYTVTIAPRHDGYEYYCVVSDDFGNSAQTDTVELHVVTPLEILSQPEDYFGSIGETATFTVIASGDGLNYQWYFMPPTESQFFKASNTTNTYTVKIAARHDGYQYYCVVTDAHGESIQTETVTLTIGTTLKITEQPSDFTGTIGSMAEFRVAAEGEGLSYRWYYKPAGDTKFYKSSSSGATYSIAITQARNGYEYYCVVSDSHGNSVQSETVKLTALPGLKITQQPVDYIGGIGERAIFTIAAEGTGLSYQWFFKGPADNQFYKASSTTDTYTVTIAARHNGYEYYCEVTDANGTKVRSDVVTLTIGTGLEILEQPADYEGSIGETASFHVRVEGEDLSYQWYFKGPSDTKFYKATNTTDTYTVKIAARHNGYEYYCVITDANGSTVRTETAHLTVK